MLYEVITVLPMNLPSPAQDAREASDALTAHIRDEIVASGGWIGFDRYMTLALYTPALGYYSGGSHKFGAAGDFVTAPELTVITSYSIHYTKLYEFAGKHDTVSRPVVAKLR